MAVSLSLSLAVVQNTVAAGTPPCRAAAGQKKKIGKVCMRQDLNSVFYAIQRLIAAGRLSYRATAPASMDCQYAITLSGLSARIVPYSDGMLV